MIYYFIIVSVLTYFVFYVDKKRAINGRRRVREKTLFLLALVGGAFGGWLAMNIHRHKTKKWTFTLLLPLFIIFHLFILYFIDKL